MTCSLTRFVALDLSEDFGPVSGLQRKRHAARRGAKEILKHASQSPLVASCNCHWLPQPPLPLHQSCVVSILLVSSRHRSKIGLNQSVTSQESRSALRRVSGIMAVQDTILIRQCSWLHTTELREQDRKFSTSPCKSSLLLRRLFQSARLGGN